MGMTGEQAYVLAKKLIEAGGGGGGTVDAYTKTQTDNLLIQKVDKEAGKGLFSGSYNDLSDAPTIPTKTSELQNDSGYLTEQAISDEWNDTTTYEVGQYCIFSNRLWKCLIQNSGEAPQEGTYWTQTSIDNEINELNSNLSNWVDITSQCNMNTEYMNDGSKSKNVVMVNEISRLLFISFETKPGIGNQANYGQIPSKYIPSYISGYYNYNGLRLCVNTQVSNGLVEQILLNSNGELKSSHSMGIQTSEQTFVNVIVPY